MSFPIIFFHQGFEPYLAFTLWQARKTNPRSPIYLLGDDSNDLTSLGVSHLRFGDFAREGREFVSVYRHLSGHELACERLCFERWFYLMTFLREAHLNEFCFLDSDYLLLKNLEELRGLWQGYDMAGAPAWAFCYFRNPQVIDRFCSLVMDRYRDENQIREWMKPVPGQITTPGATQWISDMRLWLMLFEQPGITRLDLRSPHDGIVFDGSLEAAEGFQMRDGHKKLTIGEKAVFGSLESTGQSVQFAGLHLLGKFPKRLPPLFTGYPVELLRACSRPRLFRNWWKLAQMWSYCRQRRKQFLAGCAHPQTYSMSHPAPNG
jgi:hypothetical protein